MRRKILMFLAVAFLSTAPGLRLTTQAELITNGDFETGNFDGWTLGGDTSDPTTFGVDNSNPQTGTFGAYFGPYPSDISLSQTIATIPGESYMFSFWLKNEPGGTNNSFTANFGATTVENLVDATDFYYTQRSYVVVASSTSTLLNFSFTNDFAYWELDNVSVVQVVPEPSGLVSLSVSVAFAGLYRLRCRLENDSQS